MQTQHDKPIALGAVILAAGASRRMGRAKLLLPWGETTVLGQLLRQCAALNARQTCVVAAVDASDVHNEFRRCTPALEPRSSTLVLNPDPERGMFSSIQCAANWTGWNAELTHFLIMLGDQPHLRLETLQTLLDFAAENPEKICQPMRKGRPKHPVLLPREVFMGLKETAASDLKGFLAQHANDFRGYESDDEGLDSDMDTPEDYETLLREWSKSEDPRSKSEHRNPKSEGNPKPEIRNAQSGFRT